MLGTAKKVPQPDNGMNRLEARYAQYLELQVKAGQIRAWAYEPVRLKLAKLTTYTPDFLVEPWQGRPELHECKGFLREDAAVKLKVAAQRFAMFDFKLVRQNRNGSWRITDVPCERLSAPAASRSSQSQCQ